MSESAAHSASHPVRTAPSTRVTGDCCNELSLTLRRGNVREGEGL